MLEATPRDGVSLAVTASQWTQDRVTATVVIHNKSSSSFSFANKDLGLHVNGASKEQTNPDPVPFSIRGIGHRFRTDVYFIVLHFDPESSRFVTHPVQRSERGYVCTMRPLHLSRRFPDVCLSEPGDGLLGAMALLC